MTIPLPNPALFKKVESTPSPSSETPTSKKLESTSAPKKPFVRKPHLTEKPLADHPGLAAISAELREMEEINRKAGWYDRNRNGRGSQPKKQRKQR